MDAWQLRMFGLIGPKMTFDSFVPPARRYKRPDIEFPQIPLCYKPGYKVGKVEEFGGSVSVVVKNRKYGGDVSFEDLIRSDLLYRKKVEIYRTGLYKVTLSRDPIFRVPAVKRYPRPKCFWGCTEEETERIREEQREERREEKYKRVHDMTELEHDAYLIRKSEESMKRSKRRLRDYVLLNKYDFFLTLTFDDLKVDGTDVPACMEKLQNWFDNRVRNGLRYVAVPEYHPSSGRLHVHALVNAALEFEDSGTRVVRGFNKPVRIETYRAMVASGRVDPNRCRILRTVYNTPDWRNGFSTVIPTYGSPAALANYMTKYITKGNDRIFGKFFWASKNQEKYPTTMLYDVTEQAYRQSNGKMYAFAGTEVKFEDHIVITHREQRMLDQISMIMDANGEVYEDAVI